MHKTSMAKGIKTLIEVNAGVKPGEDVVVVTDTEKLSIALKLTDALKEYGTDPTICVTFPRKMHGEAPTDAVARAILGADVVFAPTTFSLAHSDARHQACKKGARWVNMPDYREEMLTKGGLLADFVGINPLVQKFADAFTNGNTVEVTTKLGTRIVTNIKGRLGRNQSGICTEKGSFGSPPDIETHVAMIEDSTEGVMIVDGSIPLPEIGVLDEPIVVHLKKGRITSIEGGRHAKTIREIMAKHDDPSVYVAAELGIGMNPESHFNGAMLEDEGVAGTFHIGFGDNHGIGGLSNAPSHIDMVVNKPTVRIDGVVVMEDGEVLL
ncbi:MAG TPA: leucyl aminopeptidase [Bacillota bacterium]|nr:leucyl aminopeptidase [Bacillota bacterium]HOH09859.1 leucyl aminopeptidase [Bacillota bacterium]HOY88227.1 leucyl aminopeptidase [Bacillota bacterium]HPI00728.1 leucyl aminopeptidase [Bacillota bacterium]HPM64239.1 leucyl aminopeptidase [Bacillota bacterium]